MVKIVMVVAVNVVFGVGYRKNGLNVSFLKGYSEGFVLEN